MTTHNNYGGHIMPRTRHAGLALALFCLACAPARGVRIDARSRSFDRLTSADFSSVTVHTLEEAIVELRPGFLRMNLRGERPTVFVNGIMASSPTVLRDLIVEEVAEVRFLRGVDATERHGSVHSGAIIEVTTRAR